MSEQETEARINNHVMGQKGHREYPRIVQINDKDVRVESEEHHHELLEAENQELQDSDNSDKSGTDSASDEPTSEISGAKTEAGNEPSSEPSSEVEPNVDSSGTGQ